MYDDVWVATVGKSHGGIFPMKLQWMFERALILTLQFLLAGDVQRGKAMVLSLRELP